MVRNIGASLAAREKLRGGCGRGSNGKREMSDAPKTEVEELMRPLPSSLFV